MNHVRYGLSLLKRWAAGDPNPWTDADWDASWKISIDSAEQWQDLCATLRREAGTWQRAVEARDAWDETAPAGAIASVAHTAYHLGAIRQILAAQSK